LTDAETLLAEELRRSVLIRSAALRNQIEDLAGPLTPGTPLARALQLLREYPKALESVVGAEWDRASDAESRLELLRPLIRHTVTVATIVEQWLSQGTRSHLAHSLPAAVARECDALALSPRVPVFHNGPADSYSTAGRGIEAALFDPLGPLCPARSPEVAGLNFAIFEVPQIEGTGVLWRPILLGHEVAHLAVAEHGSQQPIAELLAAAFDSDVASTLAPPTTAGPATVPATALFQVALNWATELVCDAHSVQRFGPAGFASLSEYLEVTGAMDQVSITHPMGWIRVLLMRGWLGEVDSRLHPVTDPWASLANQPSTPFDPWVTFLAELLQGIADGLLDVAKSWPAPAYLHVERADVIVGVAERLAAGIPAARLTDTGNRQVETEDADVVNACWLARATAVEAPADRLAAKSLSDFEFLRRWTEAGGETDQSGVESELGVMEGPRSGGVLSEADLHERLNLTDGQRLTVTPLLPGAISGAGVDLRLGSTFIVFVRSRTPSFNPLETGADPRLMQRTIELAWGETLVLHPNELVLAATLEYLGMPPDLAAQVITRSSFGRLGLLSATAVQIHPWFRGCLTLELANLSSVPLMLTPGQRVAQLVVSSLTTPTDEPEQKYACPTVPQFSRVHEDFESGILRRLAES
jgi:deoxycytidine triphosphate deaminase